MLCIAKQSRFLNLPTCFSVNATNFSLYGFWHFCCSWKVGQGPETSRFCEGDMTGYDFITVAVETFAVWLSFTLCVLYTTADHTTARSGTGQITLFTTPLL